MGLQCGQSLGPAVAVESRLTPSGRWRQRRRFQQAGRISKCRGVIRRPATYQCCPWVCGEVPPRAFPSTGSMATLGLASAAAAGEEPTRKFLPGRNNVDGLRSRCLGDPDGGLARCGPGVKTGPARRFLMVRWRYQRLMIYVVELLSEPSLSPVALRLLTPVAAQMVAPRQRQWVSGICPSSSATVALSALSQARVEAAPRLVVRQPGAQIHGGPRRSG